MRTLIFFAVIGAFSLNVVAQAVSDKRYYEDKERGWFWFEEPVVPEEQIVERKPASEPATPSKPQEMVALDYKWLKENFEKLMAVAINNPTQENLANFAYAQRLMLDMSSRFSSRMTDFMMGEKALDENNRRPNAAFALRQFKNEVDKTVSQVISDIDANSLGIWFFFSSTCQYCLKMMPVINRFQSDHGVDVLAVSLDGGRLPGMENMDVVYDTNREVAAKFGISVTPTTMLVMNDSSAEEIAQGMRSLNDLERRYVRAARKANLIDHETYQRTKSVYEQNIYNNKAGILMINKQKMESDPAFLAEALRSRLESVEAFGTQLIDQQTVIIDDN